MELFALLAQDKNRVQRFALEPNLQKAVTKEFDTQYEVFKKSFKVPIAFDGRYTVEGSEYLLIDGFEDPEDLAGALKSPMECPYLVPTEDNLRNVLALFTGVRNAQGSYTILLQNFESRRIISATGISFFKSDKLFERITQPGLTLDTKLAGVLEGKKLAFRSYSMISRIYLLKSYYIEATDADIVKFAGMNCFANCKVASLRVASDTVARRKIKAIERSRILARLKISDIAAVAKELDLTFKFIGKGEDMKLELPEDRAQLKDVLSFLAEDIFKSPLTKLLMYTNSSRLHKPA